MREVKTRTKILALMMGASVCATSTAYAQTDTGVSDNIVVRGEKQDKSLLDTASSVSVITAEEIEERALEDISDVLNQVPNVSTTSNGQGFNIRGISNSSVTGGGDGGLATVYVDGVPLSQFSTSFGPSDTWDLEQVEVFRGAQSTNQGRNSLAGALVIRTADPVYETEFKGRFRVEEANGFNGYTVSGVANLPLIEDQVALRIAVDSKDYDGYIENTTLGIDDFNKSESLLVRAKLLLEPAAIPALRNVFTFTFTDNDTGDSFVSGPDPYARISTANILGVNTLEQYTGVWEADYDLGGAWSLSNTLTYNTAEYEEVRDDDRTGNGGVNRRERVNEFETITEEFRVHYDSDIIDAFAGFYFFSEQEDNNRTIVTGINIPSSLPPSLAPFGPFIAPFYDDPFLLSSVDNNDRKNTNYAGFFNADVDVSDLLTVNFGLRYDRERKDYVGGRDVSLDSPLPDPLAAPAPLQALVTGINGLLLSAEGSNPEVLDVTSEAWLPQAGLVFHWTDDLTTTFQVKRSYRSGGASVSLLQGQLPFDPEFALTYEGGVRMRLFENKGLFSANVFYMDWKDMQVLETIGADILVSNAGEAELKGAEASFTMYPTDEWSLFVNAGYSDTEFTSFFSQSGADFTGNRFPGSSKWNTAAGLSWQGEHFFAQADVNYQSASFANVANTLMLDARTLLNARVGYRHDNFSLSLFARNLTDEKYVTTINTVNEATFGNVFRVGDPQVFGIELRINN